jgi:hypothetical protein
LSEWEGNDENTGKGSQRGVPPNERPAKRHRFCAGPRERIGSGSVEETTNAEIRVRSRSSHHWALACIDCCGLTIDAVRVRELGIDIVSDDESDRRTAGGRVRLARIVPSGSGGGKGDIKFHAHSRLLESAPGEYVNACEPRDLEATVPRS